MKGGWVGVDLDGTLARYESKQGISVIGAPIMPMVDRVRSMIEAGVNVRILTARVCGLNDREAIEQTALIQAWCGQHLGVVLPVTAIKDFAMIALYDDRAVAVEKNTGVLLSPAHDEVRS